MWRLLAIAAVAAVLVLTHGVLADNAGACDCVSFSYVNCSSRELISIEQEDVTECGEEVQTIDVSWNQLEDMPEFLDGWIGDTLNVSHNQIEHMNQFIGEHLKEIDISSNKLTEFDAHEMKNLQILRASDNILSELMLPDDTCRLQHVNISENQFEHLNYDFSACEELVHLDASHNFIDDLPLEVLNLIKLEGSRSIVFDLRNNPLAEEAVGATFKSFEGPFEMVVDDADCTCASFKSEENKLTLCVSAMCPDDNELWSSLEAIKNESLATTKSGDDDIQDFASTPIQPLSDLIPPEDSSSAKETADIQELPITESSTTSNIQDSRSTLEFMTEFTSGESPEEPEEPLDFQPPFFSPEPSPPQPPFFSPEPSPPQPPFFPPEPSPPQPPLFSPEPSPPQSPFLPPEPSPPQPPSEFPTPPNAPRVPFLPTLPSRPPPTLEPTPAPSTSAPVRESRRRRRLMVSLILTAVGLVVASGCAAALVFMYRRRQRQLSREAATAPHALQPLVSDTTPRFMRGNNNFVS